MWSLAQGRPYICSKAPGKPPRESGPALSLDLKAMTCNRTDWHRSLRGGARKAFRSPCLPAEEYVFHRMTAFPQSSTPGPGPFRFRKRSSHPTVRRPGLASVADLLPPRRSRRPAASPANLRPSSARQRPEPVPGVASFDSVRFIASPISHPVCSKGPTSIFPNYNELHKALTT